MQSNIVGFIYRVGSHTGVYVEYHTPPSRPRLRFSSPLPRATARALCLVAQLADRTYASDPSLFRDVDMLDKCSGWTDPVIFSDQSALSPTTRGVRCGFCRLLLLLQQKAPKRPLDLVLEFVMHV